MLEMLNENLQEIIDHMTEIKKFLQDEGLEVDSMPQIMQLCIYNAIKAKV